MVFRYPNLSLFYRSHLSRISSNPIGNSLTSLLPLPIDFSSDQNHSKTTRRWHVGHSHHHHGMEGERVFRLGLAADIFLASGKAVTGYLSGSTAIIADAAHSISDIVSRNTLLLEIPGTHHFRKSGFLSVSEIGCRKSWLMDSAGLVWIGWRIMVFPLMGFSISALQCFILSSFGDLESPKA